MKFIAAVAAFALAAVASAQQPTWADCTVPAPPYLLSISSFTLNPYPLCVGKPVCADIVGTLAAGSTIEGTTSKLAVTGKYLGRVVYSDSQNLCDILAASGHPCPIAAPGPGTLSACIGVKPTAPTGINVILEVKATNGNGQVIFCKTATVTAQNCP